MEGDEAEESFCGDERVRFVGQRLAQLLRLRTEQWQRYVADEGTRRVLADFWAAPGPATLALRFPAPAPARQMPSDVKHKVVYVIKNTAECIGPDNYKQAIMFAELSDTPLEHTITLIEEILAPLLSNKKNHDSWPQFISQDIERHVETMKNKAHITKGLMSGRTFLPIPTILAKTDLRVRCAENKQDSYARTVLHAIESMIIKWSHQIRDIVQRDSVQLLLHGVYPDPQTELTFWKARKDDLLCIHDQLWNPVVQNMVKILKAKESSYYPASQDIFKEVEHALVEAQDVELYLRPLRRHIQRLQEAEFPKIYLLIPPLFHTICLIWSHSKFYSTPARIIVLLQEFCNLFIDQGNNNQNTSPLVSQRGDLEAAVISPGTSYRVKLAIKYPHLARHIFDVI